MENGALRTFRQSKLKKTAQTIHITHSIAFKTCHFRLKHFIRQSTHSPNMSVFAANARFRKIAPEKVALL
jgi:hypothetical protein